jgi:SAM-dependent methyltransferase
MEIYREALPEIDRYLAGKQVNLEHFRAEYEGTKKNIELYTKLRPGMRILEIGCGTGWFPVMAQLEGYACEGLEISWQLKEKADAVARENGLTNSGIRLGNIEEEDIGDEIYDVIVCNSVFEHVEKWRLGLSRVHKALKPGGVFIFSSTNKFSFTSGEHWWPLYGWLPDQARYSLRKMLQGPDIMKLGIDFNQFRYGLLRKAFKDLGYTIVHDRVEMKPPSAVTGWKRVGLQLAHNSKLLKWLMLTFNPATVFTCVK